MKLKAFRKIIKRIPNNIIPSYRRLQDRAIFYENAYLEIKSSLNTVKKYEKNNILLSDIYHQLLDIKLKYENPVPGSEDWLILAEYRFGGTVKNVKRNRVSVFDPRTKEELMNGGMVGGDRMSQIEHYYAPIYANYLKYFLKKPQVVLAEVGILQGTGLAIWSELFKNGRIIGLDIDLGHFNKNMESLKKRGAFRNNNLEMYEFDQFVDNRKMLKDILNGDEVDIVIDDGIHRDDAILKTLDSFLPYLANEFLYIIEDNSTVHDILVERYPDLTQENHGEITIIWKNS